MDSRFVDIFEKELTHVRRMADEFKVRHPEVADRLLLGQDPPDPYVQQLLDGFSFLAARIQLKLEAEFPTFVESLLQTVYPHYLAPTPSMAIVALEPEWDNGELGAGPSIPRGTEFSTLAPGDSVRCVYATGQDLQILPIRLADARYFGRDLEDVDNNWAGRTKSRAAIRVRLEATAGLTFDQIAADKLVFHLPPREDLSGMLYEQILAHSTAVVIQSPARPSKTVCVTHPSPVRGMGFEDHEALLPPGPRSFSGYRVLQEYFAFPGRFLFIEVGGLGEAFRQCSENTIDLVFGLREPEPRLDSRVRTDCFALHCVPAVNLFSLDNIVVDLKDEREEHLVVPDRTKTLDYEVYAIDRVLGRPRGMSRPDPRYEFQPFYFSGETSANAAGFFGSRRARRKLTDHELRHGPISEYLGSDVFLSLSGEAAQASARQLNELVVRASCTNRHVPLRHGEIQFDRDIGVPVSSVKTIAKTPPRPSHIEGRLAWRVISHLALNYRSLLAGEGESGAAVVQELLRLYVADGRDLGAAQIRALKKVAARPVFQRVETKGPIAYARGLNIRLEMEETPFTDTGVFLMGAVLNRFFSQYVTLNSFVQTELSTEAGRKVFQWPISKGMRQIL